MTRILLLIPLLCLSLPAQKAAPEPGATLTINSEPDGAKVLLDRVEVGATPLTLAVTPVPHLLALQKPGFKETFQTVKPLPNAPTLVNIRLEPVVAWVLLHSEPQGADVTDADGNIALGATPALVKVETPAVKSFTFALAGYQKQTIRLPVEDATPLVKTVALVSDSGTLKLTSDPPGARVLVNGIPRGVTPLTLERLDAEFTLEAQLDTYLTSTHTLRIAPGQTETLHLELPPQPSVLTIASIPDKARVYLNNARQGDTPCAVENLAPGQYRVRVERDGHDPEARDITLGRGEKRTVEFRLVSNLGSLEITTEPAGVTLFIDGKEAGKTTANPDETTKLSLPFRADGVATGAREITLTLKGYREHREVVTIGRGQVFTKHFSLEKLFIPDYEVKTAAGVYRGVLISRNADFVRLETRPGVITPIAVKDIISQGPIRE